MINDEDLSPAWNKMATNVSVDYAKLKIRVA
jgi:hypothetical protein